MGYMFERPRFFLKKKNCSSKRNLSTKHMLERINLGDFKCSICRTQQPAAGKRLGQEGAKAFVLTIWLALQHFHRDKASLFSVSGMYTRHTSLCGSATTI